MTTTFALGSLLVTSSGVASSRVLSKYARKSLRNVEYATASMARPPYLYRFLYDNYILRKYTNDCKRRASIWRFPRIQIHDILRRYEQDIKSWKPLLHAYPQIRPTIVVPKPTVAAPHSWKGLRYEQCYHFRRARRPCPLDKGLRLRACHRRGREQVVRIRACGLIKVDTWSILRPP